MAGRTPRPGMRGISLIEMLIALLVLSFGLLGVAGLQAQSLKNNQHASLRSQATMLGNQLLDRLRANRLAACDDVGQCDFSTIFDYGSTADPGYPPSTTYPSNTVANADFTAWVPQLAALPQGTGAVDCDATGVCTVVVEWDETRGAVTGGVTRLYLSTRL